MSGSCKPDNFRSSSIDKTCKKRSANFVTFHQICFPVMACRADQFIHDIDTRLSVIQMQVTNFDQSVLSATWGMRAVHECTEKFWQHQKHTLSKIWLVFQLWRREKSVLFSKKICICKTWLRVSKHVGKWLASGLLSTSNCHNLSRSRPFEAASVEPRCGRPEWSSWPGLPG